MNEMVPEGWKVRPLAETTDVINGRAYKLTEWEDTGTPVIRLQNLTQKGGNFYYSKLKLPERQYCLNGDLLFMWSATFGPHIWWGDKAIYHYHIWKMVPDHKKLDKQYLYFYLLQKTQEWKTNTSGMAMQHLTKSGIEAQDVTLPPLPEQKKIASILTSVDDVIENTQRQIDKLQDLKKATMNELLTQGIGHTEFKDSELGRIPKSWEVSRLGNFVLNQIGGASLTPSDFSEEGFPVIPKRAVQFGGKIILGDSRTFCKYEFYEKNQQKVINNEYVIATLRDLVPSGPSIGLIGVLDETREFILAQGVYGFLLNNVLDPLYLSFLSNTDWYRGVMRKIFVGSTQVHIRGGDFLDVLIPVPSIEEQKDIVKYIECYEAEILLKKNTTEKLSSLKKSLMQNLLTGKIRVNGS